MTLVITRIPGHDVYVSCPKTWGFGYVFCLVCLLFLFSVEVAWVEKGFRVLKEGGG